MARMKTTTVLLVLLAGSAFRAADADDRPFVRVSPRDPRYFELDDAVVALPPSQRSIVVKITR